MPYHITSVIEIQEAGIQLAARGKHVVRVLGVLKEAPLPTTGGSKEDLKPRASDYLYESYYSGSLSGPQEDPAAEPYNPRVPSLFIIRGGDPMFLQRDPSGEVPPDDADSSDSGG
jgi:hypothetical protein